MKKFISALLAVSLILAGCSSTAPVTQEPKAADPAAASSDLKNTDDDSLEEVNEPDVLKSEEDTEINWKASYLDYLINNPASDPEQNYGLVYINDDDIPEMAVKSLLEGNRYLTVGKEGVEVLNFNKEEMQPSIFFHEKENVLEVLHPDYKDGEYYPKYELYKIDDGNWSCSGSGEGEIPEETFSIKDSCGFYMGSTYGQMKSYLAGEGPADYQEAFKQLYDSSSFKDFMDNDYDEFALYDMGNDGSMELIGILKDEYSTSFGIASYKDGLVSVVEQGRADNLSDTVVLDIDKGTMNHASIYARFLSYIFRTIKNGTSLTNYEMEGEPTSAPPLDEDEEWSYDSIKDGEYQYYINGSSRGESYVNDLMEDWKSEQGKNRQYISFIQSADMYSPDPCEEMKFDSFENLFR